MKTRQGREAFAAAFRLFLDPGNYAIDFHCIAGQDRTGTLSFILLALLGVGEDDLYRDWEATAFWNRSTHFRHANAFDHLVAFFETFEGDTLNARVAAYVKACGFTEEEIARFRELMLEESSQGFAQRRRDSSCRPAALRDVPAALNTEESEDGRHGERKNGVADREDTGVARSLSSPCLLNSLTSALDAVGNSALSSSR